ELRDALRQRRLGDVQPGRRDREAAERRSTDEGFDLLQRHDVFRSLTANLVARRRHRRTGGAGPFLTVNLIARTCGTPFLHGVTRRAAASAPEGSPVMSHAIVPVIDLLRSAGTALRRDTEQARRFIEQATALLQATARHGIPDVNPAPAP